MTVAHQPPFDFAHLVEVQPVLVTSDVEAMSLTLDSIEHYSHGFVLVLWASTREHTPGLRAITASDDSGQRYSGRMLAGHGSGGEQTGWHNRVVYSFTPALHLDAQRLNLEVTSVRKMGFKPERGIVIDPADVLGGPWEFSFDLAKVRSHTEHAVLATARERPPRLRPSTLNRVIPVAQHQESNGLAITPLSLETYSDGFSLVVRTDYPKPFVNIVNRLRWQVDGRSGRKLSLLGRCGNRAVAYRGRRPRGASTAHSHRR